MTHVAIVGCGVVGAMIAYELSCISGIKVTVLDRQSPAQESTGAALGVLMGAISHKKGKSWRMRQSSLQRYETLIPELKSKNLASENAPIGNAQYCAAALAESGTIAFNQQGIVLLCSAEEVPRWRSLADQRQAQGWQLEIWDTKQLRAACPQIATDRLRAAIYSPSDRQVDPTALTLALVNAARQQGATFYFDRPVIGFEVGDRHAQQVLTQTERFSVDWVVIAAGLGSTELTQTLAQPVDLRPVLGQALRVKLPQPLGNPDFQPVITGDDIHIVPLTNGEYWIGATVEFPLADGTAALPNADRLQQVMQGAIGFCPALASAKILHTWSGLRPRPENRPAPVVEPIAGYDNLLLATGHYRNGVLLAPATAEAICSVIGGADRAPLPRLKES